MAQRVQQSYQPLQWRSHRQRSAGLAKRPVPERRVLTGMGAGHSCFSCVAKEWDAAFTLLARGAFLVSSSMDKGRIEFLQIKSKAGGECRLRNPWSNRTVTLERNGRKPEDLSGRLLKFSTVGGETATVALKGTKPPQKVVL